MRPCGMGDLQAQLQLQSISFAIARSTSPIPNEKVVKAMWFGKIRVLDANTTVEVPSSDEDSDPDSGARRRLESSSPNVKSQKPYLPILSSSPAIDPDPAVSSMNADSPSDDLTGSVYSSFDGTLSHLESLSGGSESDSKTDLEDPDESDHNTSATGMELDQVSMRTGGASSTIPRTWRTIR